MGSYKGDTKSTVEKLITLRHATRHTQSNANCNATDTTNGFTTSYRRTTSRSTFFRPTTAELRCHTRGTTGRRRCNGEPGRTSTTGYVSHEIGRDAFQQHMHLQSTRRQPGIKEKYTKTYSTTDRVDEVRFSRQECRIHLCLGQATLDNDGYHHTIGDQMKEQGNGTYLPFSVIQRCHQPMHQIKQT